MKASVTLPATHTPAPAPASRAQAQADQRPAAVAQRQALAALDASPRQVAQRRVSALLPGAVAQRMPTGTGMADDSSSEEEIPLERKKKKANAAPGTSGPDISQPGISSLSNTGRDDKKEDASNSNDVVLDIAEEDEIAASENKTSENKSLEEPDSGASESRYVNSVLASAATIIGREMGPDAPRTAEEVDKTPLTQKANTYTNVALKGLSTVGNVSTGLHRLGLATGMTGTVLNSSGALSALGAAANITSSINQNLTASKEGRPTNWTGALLNGITQIGSATVSTSSAISSLTGLDTSTVTGAGALVGGLGGMAGSAWNWWNSVSEPERPQPLTPLPVSGTTYQALEASATEEKQRLNQGDLLSGVTSTLGGIAKLTGMGPVMSGLSFLGGGALALNGAGKTYDDMKQLGGSAAGKLKGAGQWVYNKVRGTSPLTESSPLLLPPGNADQQPDQVLLGQQPALDPSRWSTVGAPKVGAGLTTLAMGLAPAMGLDAGHLALAGSSAVSLLSKLENKRDAGLKAETLLAEQRNRPASEQDDFTSSVLTNTPEQAKQSRAEQGFFSRHLNTDAELDQKMLSVDLAMSLHRRSLLSQRQGTNPPYPHNDELKLAPNVEADKIVKGEREALGLTKEDKDLQIYRKLKLSSTV